MATKEDPVVSELAVIVKISPVEKDEPSKVKPPVNVKAVAVVAPLPVTVAKVSDSDVNAELVELIFMVDPEAVMVVPPDPEMVKAPARVLTEVTTPVVSRLIVGVWPVETVMPVPASAPYSTLGAVISSANKVVPDTSVSASIYNL